MEYRDGFLYIGEVSVTELAGRFGTPFYVYDAAVIRRQLHSLQSAFASMPFRAFYAMKANGKL